MRTGLRIAGIVVGVLAVLVAALTASPVGLRLVARQAGEAVRERSGLLLTIGSIHGNLLTRATFGDVSLTVPGGPCIFAVDEIVVHLAITRLLSQEIVVPELRMDGATLLLEVGPEGKLVGWSRFEAPPATTTVPRARAEPWMMHATVSVTNSSVAVRDTAAGISAEIAGLGGTAQGGFSEFEADLAGSLTVVSKALREPVRGRLGAAFKREKDRIGIDAFALSTNLGDLEAAGEVLFAQGATGSARSRGGEAGTHPSLDLAVTSSVDVGRVAQAVGSADVAGRVGMNARVTGSIDSLTVRGDVSGDGVSYAGVGLDNLRAAGAVTPRSLEITTAEASVLGGRARASGTVALTPPASGLSPGGEPLRGRAASRRPAFDLNAEIAGLDLSRLGPLLPKGAPGLQGRLTATMGIAGSGPDASALDGTFEGGVAGLAVEGGAGDGKPVAVGDVTFAGSVVNGALRVEGDALGMSLSCQASLGGEPDVVLSVDVRDVSIAGRALGVSDLAGSGTATGTFSGPSGSPRLAATAEFPTVRYRGAEIGPVSVTASGDLAAPTARFRAFDGAVGGDATFDGLRRYRADVGVDSLDLAALLPDSLKERLAFTGRLSADASVEGELGGRYLVLGTVSGLVLSARGEDASLELPFRIRAVPDTVRVSWASLRGSLGAVSVAGRVSLGGPIDLTARLDAVDLGRVLRVARQEIPEIAGTLDGMLHLSGASRKPRITADVDLHDLAVSKVEIGSVALDASSDSTDIVFDVEVASAVSGTAAASGMIPVVPDAVHILALDPTREFGVTFSCSKFTLDAAELLPAVKGEKRFSLDGDGLLTGTADSLGSIQGRGTFDDISAAFELMSFSLTEPFTFEVNAGDLSFDRLALSAVGRRLLEAADAGIIVVSGGLTHGGDANLTADIGDLDVGRMLRAFAPSAGPVLAGKLDLVATVAGSLKAPSVSFAGEIASPVVVGVGVDGLSARGTIEPGVLRLEEAALDVRGQTLAVSGTVPIRTGEKGEGATPAGDASLDLTIGAKRLLLDHITALPSGVKSMKGELSVDLRLTGSLEAPSIEGTASLSRGSFEGFGLSRPIENVGFEAEAAGSAMILKRLEAGFGNGKVEGSGFVELGKPKDITFWLKTKLDSPEVAAPGMFDARVRGGLTWAGSPAKSQLSGKVAIEKLDVTYPIGLSDLITRKPTRVLVKKPGAPRSVVALDLDVAIDDKVSITNDVASVDLRGGVHAGGTVAAPAFSGGVYADGGTVRYLANEFAIQTLEMSFDDPRRRDPHVNIVATAEIEDRAGEIYLITLALRGYLLEAVPEFTSDPELSSPDIVALLTFGDRMGSLFVGGQEPGSSRDSFAGLARMAFLGSVFGVAENTLERLLRLDTIALDEESVVQNGLSGADITIGKRFGDRVRVNYTTAVGRFDEREVEVSLRLLERLSLDTRADPEGNHAVVLKLHVPFR